MTDKLDRVRRRWALGVSIERALIALDDPDLWLEAEVYARRLYAEMVRRSEDAPEPHEAPQEPEQPTDEG